MQQKKRQNNEEVAKDVTDFFWRDKMNITEENHGRGMTSEKERLAAGAGNWQQVASGYTARMEAAQASIAEQEQLLAVTKPVMRTLIERCRNASGSHHGGVCARSSLRVRWAK